MDGLANFNLVLIGTNFPIDKVDLSDFKVGGERLQERLRLPIAVQASRGEYALDLLPDRFQIAVVNAAVNEARVDAIIEAARTFIEEYAGRRSVAAVGHNFSGAAVNEHAEGTSLVRSLTWHEAIDDLLRSTIETKPTLQIGFRRGNETQATLRLEGTPDAEKFAFDFNFHFAMNDAEQKQTVYDAINALPASYDAASSILGQLTTFDPSNLGSR